MTPPALSATNAAARLCVALDTTDIAQAITLAEALKDVAGGVKLGKEFFTATGPQGVVAVGLARLPIFLDLKFHDIPTTVAGAIAATGAMRPAMLTVHAAGGGEMIRAAVKAAEEVAQSFAFPKPLILAVTVLTSLDDADLPAIGVSASAADQVRRLAGLARQSGADGVVCSPREVAALRLDLGPDFKLVVPGIRPPSSAHDDQKRVMTPSQAIREGADILVIGRAITGADDPAAAARAIAEEIAEEITGEISGEISGEA